jgi:hypothetical protein
MKDRMKRDSGAAVVYLLFAISACYVPLVFVIAYGCGRGVSKPPRDVMVLADAGSESDAEPADDCARDCRLWRAHGCPEGNPTAAGAVCEQVCRNSADAGIDTAHQLSCAEQATSCAAHRACPY